MSKLSITSSALAEDQETIECDVCKDYAAVTMNVNVNGQSETLHLCDDCVADMTVDGNNIEVER